MTKRKKEKAGTAVKLFSGLFFLAGLAVLVFIGISLGKETYRKRQIQNEIENLQTQIASLNRENGELNDLVSYLSTQEFQEKEAREKLNLQKSDEQMVILKKDLEQKQVEAAKNSGAQNLPAEDHSPNWQKWWKFFFAGQK